MYKPSTNYATLDFKPFDCTEKVNEFIALLKYPEVQAVLKLLIDSSIATSDLQILQRLAAVETVTGLNDFSGEISEPTIPTQLSLLAERIDTINTTSQPSLELIQACSTKTESRAHLLVAKLKGLREKKFLSSKEVVSFLRQEIDEKLRVGDNQNVRQCKKEVLEKAAQLFSDIKLDKKTYGRREVRLILAT